MFDKIADKLPQHHTTDWNGLKVIIEWPKSSIRVGEKEDGTPFKGEMRCDYGSVAYVGDADGDDYLDVYIGPNKNAKYVYVVEQLKQDGEFDEYKFLLGFDSLEDAEEMYAMHAGEDKVGEIQEMPVGEFIERAQEQQELAAHAPDHPEEESKIAGHHTLTEAYIKNYAHEVDFYQEVAGLVQDKLDSALQDAGIKAVVSSRAKRPSRLEKKLNKRAPEKNYKTFRDISDDIVDLAGCRVALYMPADREPVGEIIKELFTEVRPAKHFPKDRGPGDSLGYIADHYLVKLKPETLRKKEFRYADTQVEIQVASILMHSWAECTHDLVYKPEKGKLTPEELQILKDLNDIVQAGEAQLEKLQNSIEGRRGEELRFDIAASLSKVASVEDFRQAVQKLANLNAPTPGIWDTFLRAKSQMLKATRKR